MKTNSNISEILFSEPCLPSQSKMVLNDAKNKDVFILGGLQ